MGAPYIYDISTLRVKIYVNEKIFLAKRKVLFLQWSNCGFLFMFLFFVVFFCDEMISEKQCRRE